MAWIRLEPMCKMFYLPEKNTKNENKVSKHDKSVRGDTAGFPSKIMTRVQRFTVVCVCVCHPCSKEETFGA